MASPLEPWFPRRPPLLRGGRDDDDDAAASDDDRGAASATSAVGADTPFPPPPPPSSSSSSSSSSRRILVLDGGVSTHLENMILSERRRRRRREGRGGVNGDEDGDDGGDGDNGGGDGDGEDDEGDDEHGSPPAFAHRELWSSSLLLTPVGRDFVRRCHEEFYDAGADVASTVTYQAHYFPLPRRMSTDGNIDDAGEGEGRRRGYEDGSSTSELRLDDDVVDRMLTDGVRLAREAASNCAARDKAEGGAAGGGRERYVAASVGCYGGSLADGSEYTGNYGVSLAQLESFHRRKVQVLSSASPDAMAFETVPCSLECRAIISVLGEVPTERRAPAWISLACRDGVRLNDGTRLEDALDVIDGMDPDAEVVRAVGINCCARRHVASLAEILARHPAVRGVNGDGDDAVVKRAVAIYPNSGEGWDADSERWEDGTGIGSPEEFASTVLSAAVSACSPRDEEGGGGMRIPAIVGGCCRTGPDAVRALRRGADERASRPSG